jgi:hypothetical protein
VAFGIGITEMLHTARAAFESGAALKVTLLWANRHVDQVIFRDELDALLLAFPGRTGPGAPAGTFCVRHCISQGSVPSELPGAAAAGGGNQGEGEEGKLAGEEASDTIKAAAAGLQETWSSGRIDEAAVRSEFGDWSTQDSAFLVVGSREMKASTWKLLKKVGPFTRSLTAPPNPCEAICL